MKMYKKHTRAIAATRTTPDVTEASLSDKPHSETLKSEFWTTDRFDDGRSVYETMKEPPPERNFARPVETGGSGNAKDKREIIGRRHSNDLQIDPYV